ncbi:MAG: hypothetical protein QXY20_06910 [Thermofilum sp.]|uniref:hypothetical protein n=1 Tax=Thermofilum sp. TaxID=1961369 RepID=UPI0031639C5E
MSEDRSSGEVVIELPSSEELAGEIRARLNDVVARLNDLNDNVRRLQMMLSDIHAVVASRLTHAGVQVSDRRVVDALARGEKPAHSVNALGLLIAGHYSKQASTLVSERLVLLRELSRLSDTLIIVSSRLDLKRLPEENRRVIESALEVARSYLAKPEDYAGARTEELIKHVSLLNVAVTRATSMLYERRREARLPRVGLISDLEHSIEKTTKALIYGIPVIGQTIILVQVINSISRTAIGLARGLIELANALPDSIRRFMQGLRNAYQSLRGFYDSLKRFAGFGLGLLTRGRYDLGGFKRLVNQLESSRLVRYIRDGFGFVGRSINAMGKTVSSLLNRVITEIMLVRLGGWIKDALTGIGVGAGAGALAGAGAGAGGLIAGLGGVATAVATGIIAGLGIGGKIAEALGVTVEKIEAKANELDQSGARLGASILRASASLWSFGDSAKEWLSRHVPLVGSALGELAQGVIHGASLIVAGFGAVASFMEKGASWVAERIGGLGQSVSSLLTNAGDAVSKALSSAGAGINSVLGSLSDAISSGSRLVSNALASLNRAFDGLAGAFNGFANTLKPVFDSIQGAFNTLHGKLSKMIGGAGDAMKNALQDAGKALSSVGESVASAFNWLVSSVSELASAIGGNPTGLLGAFRVMQDELRDSSKLISFLTSSLEAPGGAMPYGFDEALTVLKEMLRVLYDIRGVKPSVSVDVRVDNAGKRILKY